MLYLYDSITIVSRLQEEFWKVMGSDYLPEMEQNGMRLVGMFHDRNTLQRKPGSLGV
jgi:hypothetical protein